jgi:protein SCO1
MNRRGRGCEDVGVKRTGVVAALLAIVAAGCGGGSSSPGSTDNIRAQVVDYAKLHGAVPIQHDPKPTFRLVDTAGHPYDIRRQTEGYATLLYFGYTHCPDECPTTMATLASAMHQLDAADHADVQVVFVTTDPARDTGPVIRRWLDRFDPDFTGLTGPLPAILKIARRVGVPVEKGKRLPSGGYDMTHGTQVLGMNGSHDVPVVWTLGTTAPEFAHDIHQLLS